jgi:hypothetical protein
LYERIVNRLAYLFIATRELRDMFSIVLIIAQSFPTVRRGGHDVSGGGGCMEGGVEEMQVMSAFGTASEL